MNPHLDCLEPYPFEKLRNLTASLVPPPEKSPILLSIGEPKHEAPLFIAQEIARNFGGLSSYPSTVGTAALRETICQWLTRRFQLRPGSLDINRHVLPVNGTREALFAIAQAVVRPGAGGLVLMPNPFYQIYEGAALLAGGQPWYINVTAESGMVPDFDSVPLAVWKQCELIYICSPGNPTGAVLDAKTLERLIGLSDEYDFVIASDECYSEIYFDELKPPPGLLEVAARLGRDDFRNCLVFHSLSKRSSVPGMRSGFVAGDARLIESFRLYRTYHGCAMSLPYQAASVRAWSDEEHVIANRRLYRQKFEAVARILEPVINVELPPASFYLWLQTPVEDTVFAAQLYEKCNVTVLPGSYLSRLADTVNPGERRVRIALVAQLEECVEGARRIAEHISLTGSGL